jgi:toxin CcdB
VNQYDIVRVSDGSLALVLQHQGLLDLPNVVVAPLIDAKAITRPLPKLNPVLSLGEDSYVLRTDLITAIPVIAIKESLGSAMDDYFDIIGAIDRLFTGH